MENTLVTILMATTGETVMGKLQDKTDTGYLIMSHCVSCRRTETSYEFTPVPLPIDTVGPTIGEECIVSVPRIDMTLFALIPLKRKSEHPSVNMFMDYWGL